MLLVVSAAVGFLLWYTVSRDAAEIQPLVFPFGHGDFCVHDGTLLLRIDRFNVDELEQLHRVEAALRFLDNTAAVEVALLEGELPLDDAITHARVADELHLPEVRQCVRFGREDDAGFLAIGAVVLVGHHPRVRVPVVPQFIHSQFMRGRHLLPITRLADRERNLFLQLSQVLFWNLVEAAEFNRRDLDRLPLVDGQSDIDRILVLVQFHVEVSDPCVRKTTVGIKRLDALQISIETSTIEIVFLTPRKLPANNGNLAVLAGRQGALEPLDVDVLDTFEVQRMHRYGAFLVAGGCRCGEHHNQKEVAGAAHVGRVHHRACHVGI